MVYWPIRSRERIGPGAKRLCYFDTASRGLYPGPGVCTGPGFYQMSNVNVFNRYGRTGRMAIEWSTLDGCFAAPIRAPKFVLASDQSSVRSWLMQPINELSSAAWQCAGKELCIN